MAAHKIEKSVAQHKTVSNCAFITNNSELTLGDRLFLHIRYLLTQVFLYEYNQKHLPHPTK